jgi:hypothetical protein
MVYVNGINAALVVVDGCWLSGAGSFTATAAAGISDVGVRSANG